MGSRRRFTFLNCARASQARGTPTSACPLRRDSGQGIVGIVVTNQRPLDLSHSLAIKSYLKVAVVRHNWAGSPKCILSIPKRFLGRPVAHGQHLINDRFGFGSDDPPAAGHGPDEAMKLTFNRLEVKEDIGMIKLDIVYDQGPGAVMNEFRLCWHFIVAK
jgi:hypothetical protein